jgi:2-amino-4-hydroxy-6-hydroxymethyldihydropteridine diphosphokinase
MREPVDAYVGLGANLGDAVRGIEAALAELGARPGVALAAASPLYRTRPVDAGGPDYVNAVARLRTTLSAPELLDALLAIECGFGRERPYRNAPRTLDLDLLLYGGGRIDSPRLTLPHPRMHARAFVLVPLADIAPQLVPPAQLAAVAGQAIARL